MRIVSLFSGAGGLDLGLVQAGHRIVWANDHDRDCVLTYAQNLGDHIVHRDIEAVNLPEIPNCDVIVGGFPCQGFSQANMLRSEKDDRNRLYLEFLRIIRGKQPKWFLAENVRGILSLDAGNAIRRIEQDFSAAGYRVQKKLFNVADFGVPQSRWRVIIAGTRNDIPNSADYCYPNPTHSNRPDNLLLPWVTVGSALRDIPEPTEPHSLLNHEYSKYKVTNRNFTGHRTTDPDKPSPTILARGNGKGGVCALQHPNNHRRMSVREQALLQTFPMTFEFIGKLNSCYRQVGNAVPVLFGKALGTMLHECASNLLGVE
ncbi:DNA cytosine methyltransferase [uncultured Desulfovibrio sp.]|uniref:DNA cytosine methyltransferase n=1 Tax=uncultured Desulfovibrio sp. TaxID=167968 RepID=UPI002805CB93|nr:DNA cytosine methyltransferase [uncultured Desulfovibrio sp.]